MFFLNVFFFVFLLYLLALLLLYLFIFLFIYIKEIQLYIKQKIFFVLYFKRFIEINLLNIRNIRYNIF